MKCTICGNPDEEEHHYVYDPTGAKDDKTHSVKCEECGYTSTEEHVDLDPVDEKCDKCGAEVKKGPVLLAQFTLGKDNSSKTNENNQDGDLTTTYTETVNGYTLTINNGVKFYTGSYDAKGNACLKLGSSGDAGSFDIVSIPEGVTKIVIYAAGYKSSSASIKINNGTAVTLSGRSASGTYNAIEVDVTSITKVSLVVSSGKRAKINTIEFWG